MGEAAESFCFQDMKKVYVYLQEECRIEKPSIEQLIDEFCIWYGPGFEIRDIHWIVDTVETIVSVKH